MILTFMLAFKRNIAFVLLMAFSAIALATPIHEAKRFTEVKRPELIIKAFPTLKSIPMERMPENSMKRSPLIATLSVVYEQNIFKISVKIANKNNYEWFIYERDGLYFYIGTAVIKSVGSEHLYDPSREYEVKPQVRREERMAYTDYSFRLLRPGETLEFETTVSAEEVYKKWPGQIILAGYSVNGVPPSIERRLSEVYGKDQLKDAHLGSNPIRIRCSGYDETTKRYACDFGVGYY